MRSRLQLGACFLIGAVCAIPSACSSSSNDSSSSAPAPAAGGEDEPTFAKSIESLLQDKCQSCHREGGIAPFPLTTYEQVAAMGQAAKAKVAAREMPPWGAFDDDDCTLQHGLKADLRLSQAQIDMFSLWVDRGMPKGDDAQRPPPRTFTTAGLADKTHTFTMPSAHEVVGGGKDDIRCFTVDPGFTEDTWIGASNVVPGEPHVVHHVLIYVDPNGESTTKAGPDGSYACFGGAGVSNASLLNVWAPGAGVASFGDKAGIKLKQGSKLVFQVHYHPGPSTVSDRTSLDIKVLPARPEYVALVVLAGNASDDRGEMKLLPGDDDPPTGPAFVIPPNASHHVEAMEYVVPTKIGNFDTPPQSLYAAGSHMHWAGVDMKIEVERAAPTSGQPAKECLMGTPKYDFNWQRAYAYDEPLEKLPVISGGDKLRFTCTYDNTPNNKYVRREMSDLHLPSPPEIHLGETTLDEMCLGVLITVRRATFFD